MELVGVDQGAAVSGGTVSCGAVSGGGEPQLLWNWFLQVPHPCGESWGGGDMKYLALLRRFVATQEFVFVIISAEGRR